MLKIKFDVTHVDGRKVEVLAGPATQVAFETKEGIGIMSVIDDMKLTNVYWLAWHAAKSGLEFEAWLETVDDIDLDVSSPVPTKPAQPAT